MSAAEIQRRARHKLRAIERQRKDPRFERVLGRFVAEGLLISNEQVRPYTGRIAVEDVLWAGQIEPRLRNLRPEDFRGVPGDRVYRWLSEAGPRKGVPARLKSFRLKADDLRLLRALADELGVTETEVVRRGLRALL